MSIRLTETDVARRDRGGRPRRAAARRAHRVDAPRGLRAPGEPARGDHQARSTASATSRSSGACVDVPDEHVGTVTQALAPRKGRVHRPASRRSRPHDRHLRGAGARPHRLPVAAADRTRGTALLHQHHAGWIAVGGGAAAPPGRGDARRPARATPPATPSTTSSCGASCSWARATSVYEGMVVGENARPGDMVVNAVREKQKTNIRTHAARRGDQAGAARRCTRSRRPSSSSPTTSWSR